MRKYTVITVLMLMVGLVQLSFGATWTIEKVTDNTEPDAIPVATVVSSGLLVAYTHNDGDNEVFVANNFSGPWVSTRVTDNALSDIATDIAANYSEQTAHIPIWWVDVPDQEMSYCKGSSSTGWTLTRITDDANDDAWGSIALDKNGFVHMVYEKKVGDMEIFYANNVSGYWVSEQVTDNGWDDNVPWMALDSDGNPHVVYNSGGTLYYTKKTAGIWTAPEMVTGGFGVNSFPFLLLDRDNKAHVTFAKSDGTFNQIYYANNVTGTWQESKVTSTSYHSAYPTLFVDPHGKIHIAYVAQEPDLEMFYANNVAGIWDIGRVTDNSVDDWQLFGRYFTCDKQGIGHIFFWNDSDGDSEIYHAYSNGPLYAGIEETTPSSPATITVTSSLFASVSTISYSVPLSGNVSLKVYDASGSLVKTLVDGTRSQGEYTVTWDGATNSGIHAAPGVYFYRLTAAGQTASVKGVLK